MTAYYNEVDPYAAEFLRNLITAGHIAPGDVDERDIRDVYPEDLEKYTQCHFFAGVGVWSLALRRAGWPDNRKVWTGSCPCQPFSSAGRGDGESDERHLWPHWFYHIEIARPERVFGEQVASEDGLGWLDLVSADLEGAGYAIGAADICAAGVGAPHMRQRLFFGADDTRSALQRVVHAGGEQRQWGRTGKEVYQPGSFGRLERRSDVVGVANTHSDGRDQDGRSVAKAGHDGDVGNGTLSGVADPGRFADECIGGPGETSGETRQTTQKAQKRERGRSSDRSGGASGGVVDDIGPGLERHARHVNRRGEPGWDDEGQNRSTSATGISGDAGPTNGFWRGADWLFCRDGRWRAVEPGTFPLAHGAAARVGRLRTYGNAIVPQVATTFIVAFEEALVEIPRDYEAPPDNLFELFD